MKYKKTRSRFFPNVINFQNIYFQQNWLKKGENYGTTTPIQIHLPKC